VQRAVKVRDDTNKNVKEMQEKRRIWKTALGFENIKTLSTLKRIQIKDVILKLNNGQIYLNVSGTVRIDFPHCKVQRKVKWVYKKRRKRLKIQQIVRLLAQIN
jgi:hypothetical protein